MQSNNIISHKKMSTSVKKMLDFYAMKADAPFYQAEFGFYVLDKWIEQGYLKPYSEVPDYWSYLSNVLMFDDSAINNLNGLGWTEGGFFPLFEEKLLEDRGDYELVQDTAGRSVLYFKGRRSGFMPEYVDHPVKDMKTWEENVKWRLNPKANGRFELTSNEVKAAIEGANLGKITVQKSVGGFMFLRSLLGPEELLYAFYDMPDLINDCMKTWFELADSVIANHQKYVTIDELFLGEDICYNHGGLISNDMIREFLLPYYQQLITNMKLRNIDKNRKLHLQIDTDGYCNDVIDIYREIGCDYMSPFEVASNCNVVETAKKYPDLKMLGGIDKRVLAESKDAIDRHLDSIIPFMRKRGGYIPTCDHGVPAEVTFENYMHYRKRMIEYSK